MDVSRIAKELRRFPAQNWAYLLVLSALGVVALALYVVLAVVQIVK